MRFSAITTLCAAPLVLAGSLQAGLVARGAVDSELVVRTGGASVEIIQNSGGSSGSRKESKGESKGDNNNNNNKGNSQSSTSVTEVIIIWINAGGNAETQTVGTTAPVAVAPAAVQTHTVIVGGAGGLVYTPEQVKAAVGDMVIFEFHANNHTTTQSAFATPCDPLAGGMDSGFMPNVNNTIVPAPQMAMQVTVATPLWFYCAQTTHCGKGMVFSINPSETDNKTQAAFKSMAIAQKGTGSQAVIVGGTPAPAAAAPAAPAASAAAPAAAAPAAGGMSMVGGTGTVNTAGACACSCLCGAAAFPNAAVQGVGAFGGIAGAMPMSALEA